MTNSTFQSFEVLGGPEHIKSRVQLLRAELKRRKLDGFLVPHSDEYQSEYLPASAERLSWLTGFTGSAGAAIVMAKKAAIFVDGRYTLQVKTQTQPKIFKPESLTDNPPAKWLKANSKPGERIGYDPRLHTISGIKALKKAVEKTGAKLTPLKTNPVDSIWREQPAPPQNPVVRYPLKHAGQNSEAKLKAVRVEMKKSGADALVLTRPECICWMLNIRGSDIAHNPVVLANAIVPASGKPLLFVDPKKLNTPIRDYLKPLARVKSPTAFATELGKLGASGRQIQLDPNSASVWVADTIKAENKKARISHSSDPVIALKAIKNKTEIRGAQKAHEIDGAAMCEFLAWLDAEPVKNLDEISAAKKLENFRLNNRKIKEISFDTISGFGPNGAIVHYRVNEKTNRAFANNTLYLVDSGGQYMDGTTDITRTVAIGNPSKEMRDNFSRVLKGHIAIAQARFPKGTTGVQIDILARKALWDAGLDYEHGTGHGVGAYLAVHEGPQSISKRGQAELKAGMIISNEPGYYKAGEYGIRIENLVLVTETNIKGGEQAMLAFETLTLAPIDLRCVDRNALDESESNWLNAYHARVRKTLSPHLSKSAKTWLDKATRTI